MYILTCWGSCDKVRRKHPIILAGSIACHEETGLDQKFVLAYKVETSSKLDKRIS